MFLSLTCNYQLVLISDHKKPSTDATAAETALETAFCSCLMILIAVSARVYTAAVAVATFWLMAVDCAAAVPLPANANTELHQPSAKVLCDRQ